MVTPKFTAVALKLVEPSDSECDAWDQLVAVAADAPADLASQKKRKFERLIYRCGADPVDARKFGLWLTERCGVPFSDHTTAEATAAKITNLLGASAGTGRFGNWAARQLGRLPPTR